MIKKDYIERLTQQIAMVFAKLMGKETKESLEIIDEAYNEWLKLDRSFVDALSEDELLEVLVNEKGLNVHQLEFLAELLNKEGEILFDENQLSKSKDKLKKSLILFHHVDNEQQLFSLERQRTLANISNIIQKIADDIR